MMGLKFRSSLAIATLVLGVSSTYLFDSWFIRFEEIRRGIGSLCGEPSMFLSFDSTDGEEVGMLFAYFYGTDEDPEGCFRETVSDPAEVVLEDQTLSPDGRYKVRRVVTKRIVFYEGKFAPVYSIVLFNSDQIVTINSRSLQHAMLFEEQRTRELH